MLWGGGVRQPPKPMGSGSNTPLEAPWHLGVHMGMLGGGSGGGPRPHPVCSCIGSLLDAGDAWMKGAFRPILLCAAKHLPGRCHIRCVTCPFPACSGEGRIGSWLTEAQQGGSLGFWVLVWGCTHPSTHLGWCKLTLLPAWLCPEKRGWSSAIPAGSALGVPATQEHLWPTVPLGRARMAGAQTSPTCPNSCHALLPSPLWDSPATSVFLVHEVQGCVA